MPMDTRRNSDGLSGSSVILLMVELLYQVKFCEPGFPEEQDVIIKKSDNR